MSSGNIQATETTKDQAVKVLKHIEVLEKFINDSEFHLAQTICKGQILLALLSKSLTVSRAVCELVRLGFSEEAFGMTRTLADTYFIVRYISNQNTEDRALRYGLFFAKDRQGWVKIFEKYYPHIHNQPLDPQTEEELGKIAADYNNPYDWTGERYKTSALAHEPSTYEFDANGVGTTAAFTYEAIYRYTSHFVHSTIRSLSRSHLMGSGEVFVVRGSWIQDSKAHFALSNVLTVVASTFIAACRALWCDQPENIQDMLTTVLSL